jgi:hypothetical protein
MNRDAVFGMIISAVFSLLISTIFHDLISKFFNGLGYFFKCLVFRKKGQKDIIGIYYGYYLKNDGDIDVILKESLWEIYSSVKKGCYHINTFIVSDTERDETYEILLNVKFSKERNHLPTKEEKRKIKELQISYKGEMFIEAQHFLFSLKNQKDGIPETIFERRFLPGGDSDNKQIIGMSLAINSNNHIRTNMSILSRTKFKTKEEFYEIIELYGGATDDTTYNMLLNG